MRAADLYKFKPEKCFPDQFKVAIFALPILGCIVNPLWFSVVNAGVVKLVDTLDLGSSASRCEGSSPFARTDKLF